MQHSTSYNLWFAAVMSVVCAVFVSGAAVSLKDRQEINAALDKQRNVLIAAGLAKDGEKLSRQEIEERFAPIRQVVIDLETGEEHPGIDPMTFDYRKEAMSPDTSRPAPDNLSRVQRLANNAMVYQLQDDSGAIQTLIFPIEGYGLWGTLYGFLALDADLNTIRGDYVLRAQRDSRAGWRGRQSSLEGPLGRTTGLRRGTHSTDHRHQRTRPPTC